MITRVLLTIYLVMSMSAQSLTQTNALKVGVIGLGQTHVHWIFNSNERDEFTIVGIVEADSALAKRYTDLYK